MPKKKFKTGAGLGNDLYDGAATFGVAMAWIYLIIGNIIGWGLVALGIFLLLRKEKFSGRTTAQIVEAECSKNSDVYNCLLQMQYEINNTNYEPSTTTSSSTYYQSGTSTDVKYNPDNPKEVSMMPSSRLFGWISLSIGLFIIICVFIQWYLARRYKFAAAATGIGTGVNMVT